MDLRATPSVGHSNSMAPSGSQRNMAIGAHVYYQPQYQIPRQAMKHYFGGRKEVEGRGRSFVMYGILQIIVGLICFVLALIAVSVTIGGNGYNAGTISGLIFITTGMFGCMVGSSMSDCYAMTYLILNIISDMAAVLGIGISAWEINGIGSMSTVASSDGYIAVKCALVMISCFLMFIICTHQVRKLRHTPCCKRESEINFTRQQEAPLGHVAPPSNNTTNSSWHWNLQQNVNQSQRQNVDTSNLPMEYLANMDAFDNTAEETNKGHSYEASRPPFQPSNI